MNLRNIDFSKVNAIVVLGCTTTNGNPCIKLIMNTGRKAFFGISCDLVMNTRAFKKITDGVTQDYDTLTITELNESIISNAKGIIGKMTTYNLWDTVMANFDIYASEEWQKRAIANAVREMPYSWQKCKTALDNIPISSWHSNDETDVYINDMLSRMQQDVKNKIVGEYKQQLQGDPSIKNPFSTTNPFDGLLAPKAEITWRDVNTNDIPSEDIDKILAENANGIGEAFSYNNQWMRFSENGNGEIVLQIMQYKEPAAAASTAAPVATQNVPRVIPREVKKMVMIIDDSGLDDYFAKGCFYNWATMDKKFDGKEFVSVVDAIGRVRMLARERVKMVDVYAKPPKEEAVMGR